MDNCEASLPAKTETKFFYGYIIVLAALLMQTVISGPRTSFGVFFKPLITEFGWTRALVSGAFSMSTIVQGLLGIAMGGLNDRLGPRVVMTTCGFLVGSGFMLLSLTNAAWQLYLFYVLMIGMGMGGVYVSLMSTVARWFIDRRGMMTGIVAAGAGIGGLIAPPIINWLIFKYEWRTSYLMLGGATLAIITLTAQCLKRDPAQIGLVPYGKGKGKEKGLDLITTGISAKEAISTRQFWMSITMLFCYGFAIFTIMIHIVPHVTDLGISATTAANVLAVLGGGLLAGGIILGTVADRIGNRQAFTICFVLISAAVLWLLSIKEVWMFYLCAAILGLGGGGGATLVSLLAADLFGMRSHGLILGIYSCGYTIGAAAGPLIAGYIFDASSNYQCAFLLSAALGIAGLLLSAILRPVKRKAPPQGY